MANQRLRSVVEDGEALRFEGTTRDGDGLGLTDRRLLLARDDEVVGVDLANVEEVRVKSFDWYLALLSLALVGFGLYSTRMNVLGGAVFVAAGAGSFLLTLRKRGRVRVVMQTRPRPLVFHLDETEPFEQAFERQVQEYEHRYVEDDPGDVGDEP